MTKDNRNDEIRQACHEAMIRHLDGTPNRELRELVQEFRQKAEHTEVFKPQSARTAELVYKNVAEKLESVIEG